MDVVTDGEVERGAYYLHIMNGIEGIDMERLERKVMRAGAYSTLVPAVRGPLRLRSSARCWREWSRADQAAAGRAVVKFTLPGPMTLADGMVDLHYGSPAQLEAALVPCIQQEVAQLVAAGCRHIQIGKLPFHTEVPVDCRVSIEYADEPVMMRYPDAALERGLANLAECFAGLGPEVTRTSESVHNIDKGKTGKEL